MCPFLRWSFVIVFGLIPGGFACAGWITIRNDTARELVIQDVVFVNGKAKPVKSIKLLPGESIRENQTKAGSKSIWVFDPVNPKTPIGKGKIDWGMDDVTFSIKSDKDTTTTTIAALPPPKKQ